MQLKFDWVEVFTLDVLDEGELEGLLRGHVLDEHRDVSEAKLARRAEPSFTGDEDVAGSIWVGSHDEGLQDPLLADADHELIEGRVVEVLAGLIGVGVELDHRAQKVVVPVCRVLRGRQQGTQALTEGLSSIAHGALTS